MVDEGAPVSDSEEELFKGGGMHRLINPLHTQYLPEIIKGEGSRTGMSGIVG